MPKPVIRWHDEVAMNKPEDVRLKCREQIERGWLQAQAGRVVDGEEVFRKADERIRQR